jgi:hypothetical protein
MSSEQNEPKIGAGHAAAMYRQGLAELRAALYPESNVAQPAQYGLYGTSTQREVYEDKQPDPVDPAADSYSAVDERLAQAERSSPDEGREPPEAERA